MYLQADPQHQASPWRLMLVGPERYTLECTPGNYLHMLENDTNDGSNMIWCDDQHKPSSLWVPEADTPCAKSSGVSPWHIHDQQTEFHMFYFNNEKRLVTSCVDQKKIDELHAATELVKITETPLSCLASLAKSSIIHSLE